MNTTERRSTPAIGGQSWNYVKTPMLGRLHRNAAVGVLEGAVALGIPAIGRALAFQSGMDSHPAVKEVDRLLSNTSVDV